MRSLALLLALVSLPAAAQADWLAFFPGEVGDEWRYDFRRVDCAMAPGGCTSTYETVTIRVVETAEVDGVEVLVFEGPGGRAAYGVNPADTTVVRRVLDDNGTGLPLAPPPACHLPRIVASASAEPQDVRIGGRTHRARWAGFNCSPAMTYAAGIGLIDYDWSWTGGGGASESEHWDLLGARVGGVNYGALATAVEGAPAAGAVRVGPNPARGAATVAVEAAGAVVVEVVDVLGRVVWTSAPTSSGAVEVDTAWVGPGRYVVRVRAGGRPVGTAPLTVVR